MLGPGPGLRCSRCGCRVSVSALVTVTVLGLRLRLVIEKLTGTRLTLVPSLRSAPTRDSGELVSASCRSLRECAGVVLTPEPAYPAGAAAGGAGGGRGLAPQQPVRPDQHLGGRHAAHDGAVPVAAAGAGVAVPVALPQLGDHAAVEAILLPRQRPRVLAQSVHREAGAPQPGAARLAAP